MSDIKDSTFKVGVFKNKWVIGGIIFEVIVMLSIAYIPFFQGIFGTTTLKPYQWIYLLSFMPIMFFAEELRKYMVRKMDKRNK